MSSIDSGTMEIGKLQTNSKVGHVFYFILDQLHPAHPHDNSLYCYYVVSLCSSYTDAFYFFCSKLCNVIDREIVKEWHELFQRLFAKQSLSEFVSHVESALMQNTNQSHRNREMNDNKNENRSATTSLQKKMIQEVQEERQYILCYDKHAALIALKKLELLYNIDVCTENKVPNFPFVTNTQYVDGGNNHNDKIVYKDKEIENAKLQHTSGNASQESIENAINEHKTWKSTMISLEKPNTMSNVEHQECISCTPPTLSHQREVHENSSKTTDKNANDKQEMKTPTYEHTNSHDPKTSSSDNQVTKSNVAQITLLQNNALQTERCTNSSKSNYNKNDSNHDESDKSDDASRKNNHNDSIKSKTEIDSSVHEMEQMIVTLSNKINSLSTKYAENLNMFTINNDRTVAQLTEQFNKREEELNRVYRVALQNRDVRIAHLTEDLWELRRSYLELMERSKVMVREHPITDKHDNGETNNEFNNNTHHWLSHRTTEIEKQAGEANDNELSSTSVYCNGNGNTLRERWWQEQYAKVTNERDAAVQELHVLQNDLTNSNKELQNAYDTIAKLHTALRHIKTELPFVHQSLDEQSVLEQV